MNIDIDGLQAFVKIADLGTFRRASEALYVAQPALSRRMRKLEENLGVKLLNRTTRRIRLTVIGKEFLPKARRLIQELENSVASLKDMAKHGTGQVTLACIPTAAIALLPTIISEYHQQYPHNRIRLVDVHASKVLQMVLKGDVEFGICVWGKFESEIKFERLFDDPFVLACRRDHPLAKAKKVKWADLAQHQLITVGRLSGNRIQLDFVPSNPRAQQQWSFEIQQSFWTGLGLVEAGIGVIAVPQLALSRERHPQLVGKPLIMPTLSRTIGVIQLRGTTLSPAAHKFLSLLKKRWATKKMANITIS